MNLDHDKTIIKCFSHPVYDKLSRFRLPVQGLGLVRILGCFVKVFDPVKLTLILS